MIYGNLLYFLAAIVLFSLAGAGEEGAAPALPGILLPPLVLAAYSVIARSVFHRLRPLSTAGYLAAERRLSLLAVGCFALLLFAGELKLHLRLLLGSSAALLLNPAGLGCFFLLLCSMWLAGRRQYEAVFQRQVSARAVVLGNLRVNLPLVLPWLLLSLLGDIALLVVPKEWADLPAPWADLLSFALFAAVLALFFPPLVCRLWGCRELPAGPLRDGIEAFCRRLGFRARIMLWPLFDGQAITAGVMGLLPSLRYLLLTPALLETMPPTELRAVLAHEIGHVAHRHLLLYLLLFFGFSAMVSALAQPLSLFLLHLDVVFRPLAALALSPETVLALLGGLPLLILLLVFFRFVLGWFIRNFERQADQYVFKVLGSGTALIAAFERIAVLSGDIRELPSWHHYGLGERIRWLESCENDRRLVHRHDRRLRRGLMAYTLMVAVVLALLPRLDQGNWMAEAEGRLLELTLQRKLAMEPDNPLWFKLAGDLLQEKRLERRAMEAYERALALEPLNAETQNNLAWLLLTARDERLRDPRRALTLARSAATLHDAGYILDTLATAYWANGLLDEALMTGEKALRLDPDNRDYYRTQLEKFRGQKSEGGRKKDNNQPGG